MNIIRWHRHPFADLISLRRTMDRLFEEDLHGHLWRLVSFFGNGREMPLDMYQTADSVTVKATLPGVKSEDVDISISDDTLTIKGETKDEEDLKGEDYIRRERTYGSFHRSVILPSSLQADKAEASFENGVLTLTIPKAEESKPKQIKRTKHPFSMKAYHSKCWPYSSSLTFKSEKATYQEQKTISTLRQKFSKNAELMGT